MGLKSSPRLIGHLSTILDRFSSAQNQFLTEAQALTDGLVSVSLHESTHLESAAAMLGAGWVGRFTRIGGFRVLGGASAFSRLLHGISHLPALAAESAAFAGIERAMHEADRPARPFFTDWVQGGITLSGLKLFGGLSRGQNIVLRHLFTDAGLVGSRHAAAALSLAEIPQESLAHQMLKAETTNWHMQGSLAFAHSLSPRLAAAEKSLEVFLKNQTTDLAAPPRPGSWFFPFAERAFAAAAGPGRESSHSLGLQNKEENLAKMASSLENGSSFRPPPSSSRSPSAEESFQWDPHSETGQTLHSFLNPAPSLKGRHFIPGLSEERVLQLEAIFEKGGSIAEIGGRPILIDLPSGSRTHWADFQNVTREDILFHWLWKNHFGFLKAPEEIAARSWEKLQVKGLKLGLQIGHECASEAELLKFGHPLRFTHEILESLPDSLLKTPQLRAIWLLTERRRDPKLSAFQNTEMFLYDGMFRGSRRNLGGMILHELGHATEDRYAPGPHGDPSIPEPVRQRMHQAHGIIAGRDALIGLDYAGGPEYRRNYQKNSFGEFIADLHLTYVGAGSLLRRHISSFPQGSETGEAWDFVYRELKDRIFSGRVYDYLPSFEGLEPASQPFWETPFLNPSVSLKREKGYIFANHGSLYRMKILGNAEEVVLGRSHFASTAARQNISSRHLRIFRFEDFYFVQDLGSKNGTRIQGAEGRAFSLRTPDRRPSHPLPLFRGDRVLLPGAELLIQI